MINQYLLDTHTLLWWWTDATKLSTTAYHTIKNRHNHIHISPINIWEMSIKYHKGKLPEAELVLQNLEYLLQKSNFVMLNIHYRHAKLAGEYQQSHADPFDRMLIAQAECEKLILISKDTQLPQFDVPLLW